MRRAPRAMCALLENKGKAPLYLTEESETLYDGQRLRLLKTCITDAVIALSTNKLLKEKKKKRKK